MAAVFLCQSAPWVGTSRDFTTIGGTARQTDADVLRNEKRNGTAMGLQPELLFGSHRSKTPIEKTAAFK